MKRKKAKPGLPAVRKHRILYECIDRGLRGFLWNDLPEKITEQTIEFATDRAQHRIWLEIDEKFR